MEGVEGSSKSSTVISQSSGSLGWDRIFWHRQSDTEGEDTLDAEKQSRGLRSDQEVKVRDQLPNIVLW